MFPKVLSLTIHPITYMYKITSSRKKTILVREWDTLFSLHSADKLSICPIALWFEGKGAVLKSRKEGCAVESLYGPLP